MPKVTAQAKPRTYNGHQFNDYWCVGLHWPGLEPQTRTLTDEQLIEMVKEQEDGHPIRVISVESDSQNNETFIPAPLSTQEQVVVKPPLAAPAPTPPLAPPPAPAPPPPPPPVAPVEPTSIPKAKPESPPVVPPPWAPNS